MCSLTSSLLVFAHGCSLGMLLCAAAQAALGALVKALLHMPKHILKDATFEDALPALLLLMMLRLAVAVFWPWVVDMLQVFDMLPARMGRTVGERSPSLTRRLFDATLDIAAMCCAVISVCVIFSLTMQALLLVIRPTTAALRSSRSDGSLAVVAASGSLADEQQRVQLHLMKAALLEGLASAGATAPAHASRPEAAVD